MKTIARSNKPFLSVFVAILVITFLLLHYAKHWLHYGFTVHWGLLAVCGVLIVSPLGRTTLGQPPHIEKHPWPKALGLIVIIQIGLMMLFHSTAYTLLYAVPVTLPQPMPTFKGINQTLLWHWGLFPWAAAGLYAVTLGFFGFVLQKKGVLSSVLYPIFHSRHDDALGTVIDFFARISAIFSLASLFVIITLLLTTTLKDQLHWPMLQGAKVTTLALCTLLLLMLVSKRLQHITRGIAVHVSLLMGSAFIVIGLVMVLLLGSYVFTLLAQYAPALNQTVNLLSPSSAFHYWLIFIACWWLGWTPLLGGMIATAARGYSIRAVLLMTLGLPCLVAIGTTWLPTPDWISQHHALMDALMTLLSLAGGALIGTLCLGDRPLNYILRSTLPYSHEIKIRPQRIFAQRFLILIAALVVAYLVTGLVLPTFITLCLTVMILPITLCLPIGLWLGRRNKSFSKHNQTHNNETTKNH